MTIVTGTPKRIERQVKPATMKFEDVWYAVPGWANKITVDPVNHRICFWNKKVILGFDEQGRTVVIDDMRIGVRPTPKFWMVTIKPNHGKDFEYPWLKEWRGEVFSTSVIPDIDYMTSHPHYEKLEGMDQDVTGRRKVATTENR